MMIDNAARRTFQETVWRYYQQHGRHDLPWRLAAADGSFDPYRITVSELMLQQTQVSRVVLKYQEFLRLFPTVQALAKAPLGDVLRPWNGLGYNRRAKYLHQAARQIADDYGSHFPTDEAELIKLPGIGPATACAILAYTFDQPVAFLETNIRTVYIHHFFNDQVDLADKQILELVNQTLDTEQPREWYWALMDYGAHLKRSVGNLNQHSKSYSRQSKFEGSARQIRGQVIRALSTKSCSVEELQYEISDQRLEAVITDLVREGLVQQRGNQLSL